jgi:hypothetical protein
LTERAVNGENGKDGGSEDEQQLEYKVAAAKPRVGRHRLCSGRMRRRILVVFVLDAGIDVDACSDLDTGIDLDLELFGHSAGPQRRRQGRRQQRWSLGWGRQHLGGR